MFVECFIWGKKKEVTILLWSMFLGKIGASERRDTNVRKNDGLKAINILLKKVRLERES